MSNSKIYSIPIDSFPTNAIVYRWDEDDFLILDLNDRAAKTDYLNKHDTIGKHLCTIFPAVKSFGLFDVLKRVHETGVNEFFNTHLYVDKRINGWRKNEVIKLQNGDIMALYEDQTHEILMQKELKESEEMFHTIAENSLMGIFIYQDKYKYVNPAISKMIGYSAEELYKISPVDLVEDSMKAEFIKTIKRRLKGEKFPKKYDNIHFITKSGESKLARLMVETIEYKDGYAGLGTIIDMTDMKKISNKLKMLAQAVEQTDDMVMITDKEGIITYVNDAYIIQSGYRHNELIGKTPRVVKSDMHNKEFYEKLWAIISSGQSFSGTIINKKKNKDLYHIEATITPIIDNKNEITSYVATAKDITDKIKMQEELNKRANLDSLTGAYNRYKGNEIIDSIFDKFHRYNSGFALLMLDIDYFKKINDTYGHDVGDMILVRLSELISMHMRKSDYLIRWGGEEFIIISEHLDDKKAQKFGKKLKIIVEAYEFDQDIKLTISIGVTAVRTSDTKQTILKRVDDALYEAKDAGRNCVKFI